MDARPARGQEDEGDVRRCCMCGVLKPEAEFALRSLATGKRQSHCRACHAAYRRNHYLEHREEYIARETARINAHRIDNRVRIFEYLSAHPCVDCGETDVIVLEFDHRDRTTKRRDVALLAASSSWKVVAAEIEKCDVRCANCHRKRTAVQLAWTRRPPSLPGDLIASAPSLGPALELVGATKRCRDCGTLKPIDCFSIKNKRTGRRASISKPCVARRSRSHYRQNKPRYLERGRRNKGNARRRAARQRDAYLAGKACVDCGETDPLVLEFDHRDGTDKEFAVGVLIARGQWQRALKEIAKCDIRCANCHRRRTAAQFAWTRLALTRARVVRDGRVDGHTVGEPSLIYDRVLQWRSLAGVA